MKRLQQLIVVVALFGVAFSLYCGLRAGLASYLYSEAQQQIGQGDQDAGVRLLEHAQEWDGDHAAAQLLLARRALGEGRLSEGQDRLTKLYEDGVRDESVLDLLARLAEEGGKPREAHRYYEELLDADPNCLVGALGLARVGNDKTALRKQAPDLDRAQPSDEIRGVALFHLTDEIGSRGYGTPAAAHSLLAARRAGVRDISLRVPGHQETVATPSIRFGKVPAGGESDIAVRRTIRDARALGMRVMLKPHIMLDRINDDEWRGTIAFDDPDEQEAWWRDYNHFLLHYARLAAEEEAEMLCVGVELRALVQQSPERWRQLIHKIREIYAGKLTYAANWYHEFLEVAFWSDLDFIGVQFFFPLGSTPDPSVEQLRQSLQRPIAELRDLVGFVNRPVVFTEVGYKATPGATRDPWVWAQEGQPSDEALQARAYRAILLECRSQPWLRGLYWWNWLTEPQPDSKFAPDFTPQGKLAEQVLKEYWVPKE